MRVRRCASFAVLVFAWIGVSFGLAQSTAVPVPHIGGVTGEPYTATFTVTHRQTLADGTQIHQTSKSMRYRDSEGRMRFEDYPPPSATDPAPSEPNIVTIVDPVANRFIILETRQKIAVLNTPHASSHANVPPVPGGAHGPVAMSQLSGSSAFLANTKAEDLGFETIDGFTARGRRITRVIPAGTNGSNRAISIISETWTATDLKVVVRSKMIDPRSGENTTDMKSLALGEPEPALFQIPPGYTVQQQN